VESQEKNSLNYSGLDLINIVFGNEIKIDNHNLIMESMAKESQDSFIWAQNLKELVQNPRGRK